MSLSLYDIFLLGKVDLETNKFYFSSIKIEELLSKLDFLECFNLKTRFILFLKLVLYF
jgi:hypothetical protein